MRSLLRARSGSTLPATTWAIVLAAGESLRSRHDRARLLGRAIARIHGVIPVSRTVVVVSGGQDVPVEHASWTAIHVVQQHEETPPVVSVLAGLVRVLALGGGLSAELLVMPADVSVGDEAAWRRSLPWALAEARRSRHLVVLGLRPAQPERGCGWIIPGPIEAGAVRRVREFAESVEAPAARRLFAQGALVNSRTFAVSQDVLLRMCARALWPVPARAFDVSCGVSAGAAEVLVLQVPMRGVGGTEAVGNCFAN